MNTSQLTELEDDIQEQLAAKENRVRDEASMANWWIHSPIRRNDPLS